jgi:hypothetical protein
METEILVGGFKLGVLAILFVQALKLLGVTEEKWLNVSVVSVATFFTILWGVQQLVPAATLYVNIITLGLSSIASCVLGYKYAVKPALQKVGISVSVADLEG